MTPEVVGSMRMGRWLVKAAIGWLCTAAAFAYDFSYSAYGPQHVVRGYTIYIQITASLLDGTRDYIFHYVSGLPVGSTYSYPLLDEYCCGGNRGWSPENTLLAIDVPAGAAAGSYPLVLSAESGGVTRETAFTLRVDPVPPPLAKVPIVTVPPLVKLSEWEANMVSKGGNLCDEQQILDLGIWEGSIWYYDGIRVYYQIAGYTEDSSWETCAGYVRNVYRPYVLDNGGAVQGYRVFPHGLSRDFLSTGSTESRTAVVLLAESSAYARAGGGVHPSLVRESAYIFNAYRVARGLGEPEHRNYQRTAAFLLGHLDQWFVSGTEDYMQPFMVGLAAEALIQYWQESRDPRIPPAIKTAMDEMWDWAWVPADKSFFYESTGNTSSGAPDLNLLIAPAFAWLYMLTGDPLYQQRGDQIFVGGVEGAWIAQGKQFSQNYRWSFDFVDWRLHPKQPLFADGFETGNTAAWK